MMTNAEKNRKIKLIREVIGEAYAYDERRGAKTNEYGMTKSQVIALATEIVEALEEEEA